MLINERIAIVGGSCGKKRKELTMLVFFFHFQHENRFKRLCTVVTYHLGAFWIVAAQNLIFTWKATFSLHDTEKSKFAYHAVAFKHGKCINNKIYAWFTRNARHVWKHSKRQARLQVTCYTRNRSWVKCSCAPPNAFNAGSCNVLDRTCTACKWLWQHCCTPWGTHLTCCSSQCL